jgi:hypothetical protein
LLCTSGQTCKKGLTFGLPWPEWGIGFEFRVGWAVLRTVLKFLRLLGMAILTLLFLAAMSEGVFSRDLTLALTAALAAAALLTALLAYRRMRKTTRDAQEMFAELERAARRANAAAVAPLAPLPRKDAPKAAPKPSRSKQRKALPIPANEPGSARMAGTKPLPAISDNLSAAEDALLLAMGNHDLDISLEPVVELQTSEVVAFRVHAALQAADGSTVHVRRIEGKHTGIDPARFDAELFHAAASAMRRLMGVSADTTPFICPLGLSVLSSHKDLRKIVGMMTGLPGLQSGLVIEIPGDALRHEGLASTGAALLLDAGLRLAIEGPLPKGQHLEILQRFAFEFWSLKGVHIGLSAKSTDTGETGTRIVATHLAEDHDVVAIIDAGVKLVCGPLFSHPKPVRRRGDLGPDLPGERKGVM